MPPGEPKHCWLLYVLESMALLPANYYPTLTAPPSRSCHSLTILPSRALSEQKGSPRGLTRKFSISMWQRQVEQITLSYLSEFFEPVILWLVSKYLMLMFVFDLARLVMFSSKRTCVHHSASKDSPQQMTMSVCAEVSSGEQGRVWLLNIFLLDVNWLSIVPFRLRPLSTWASTLHVLSQGQYGGALPHGD